MCLGMVLLTASCLKEEIVGIHPSNTIKSETIVFNANLDWGAYADVTTKGGAANHCDRLGYFTLKSANSSGSSLPVGIYEETGITHSNSGASNIETKGSVISTVDVKSFMVWASLTGQDETSLFYPAEGVLYKEETRDGVKIFASDDKYFWPGAGTIDFVAVANAPASGFTPNLSSNGTKVESFTYTVPTDPTKQNDIVIATPASVSGSLNESVDLTFNHIMSAVNVKIGTLPEAGITIQSMSLKNIYNSGKYNLSKNSWDRNGTKANYPILDAEGNEQFNPSESSTINMGSYTLMVLPQQLPDDAILEVVCLYKGTSIPVTLSTPIAKDPEGNYYEWKQSKTTNYIVSIDENYHMQVIPQGNVLDAHYIMTTGTVNVTELGNGYQWFVEVEADNLTTVEDVTIMKNDANVNAYIKDGYWINSIDGNIEAVRGTKRITGNSKGTTDYIVFIPENITAGDRRITLTYGIVGQEENAKKEYLYQKCPYWDVANSWGWEKVDDQNSGTYGFEWTRKVCYMFAYKIGGLHNWQVYDENYILGIINPLIEKFNASEYVTIDKFKHYQWDKSGLGGLWGNYEWKQDGERIAVIIDYTKLTLDGASSSNDGWSNTKAFFDARNIIAFEDALKAVTKVGEYNDDGSLQTAFRMLETYLPGNGATQSEATCGKFEFSNYTYTDPTTGTATKKMFREFGELDDASGILKYVIMRNAYDIVSYSLDDNNSTQMLDMNAEKILWYLPAYGQYVNLDQFEFATGDATFTASDFWSSTAAPNNKAYTGKGEQIDRHEKRKVIVQRYLDPLPHDFASVSIDNTSLTGGDNGDTNNWL